MVAGDGDMVQRPENSLIGWHRHSRVLIALLLFTAVGISVSQAAATRQEDGGYTPASGHVQVIAQGVVVMPGEELVWRTVRYSAFPDAEAEFVTWPLGFVLATSAPLLLTDQATGNQLRLGPGEATLVHDATIQRRASLDAEAAPYLAIELVPSSQAEQNDVGTVLQTWPADIAESGPHDIDLVRSVLIGTEEALLPATTANSLLLVTEGSLVARAPGEEGRNLLAGEAMTFSDELEILQPAGNEAADGPRGVFVAAVIGPSVPGPSSAEVREEPTADATARVGGDPGGSITIQVFNCPSGMKPEGLVAEACSPATEDIDFVISNDMADMTLTLADSVAGEDVYTWKELPLGEYRVIEVVLPSGFDTYLLTAEGAVDGDPMIGYNVRLDEASRDVSLRVYNFPAP
jgi:hypothetical protein